MDLDTTQIAIGDLQGDGREYAAVFLAEWVGGTGIFTSLNVVVDSGGSPYHLAGIDLGDHIGIDSVLIHDRIIYVNALVHRYGQELEPPDSSTTWWFKLENHTLKETSGAKF